MQTVFRLIECNTSFAVENIRGYFFAPVSRKTSTLTPSLVWKPYWKVPSYQVTVRDQFDDELWTKTVYGSQARYDGQPLSASSPYKWAVRARDDEAAGRYLDPLGLHYVSGNGINYLVSDIFQLGTPVPLEDGTSSGVTDGHSDVLPEATALLPVSPNPFSRLTAVRYSLKADEHVRLSVYDARGTLVRKLKSGEAPAGHHQAVWDGRDDNRRPVAAGVYFVRFQAGDYGKTEKMMLLK